MSGWTRRELARISGWLFVGAAVGARPGAGAALTEIDVPGGVALMRSIVGADARAAVTAARLASRDQRGRRVRVVFDPPGEEARIVADLDRSGYRLTLRSAAGGLTLAGTAAGVVAVTVHARGRRRRHGAYDTAIQGESQVTLTSSSALARRRLGDRVVEGATLPPAYDRLAWLLARRLAEEGRPAAER